MNGNWKLINFPSYETKVMASPRRSHAAIETEKEEKEAEPEKEVPVPKKAKPVRKPRLHTVRKPERTKMKTTTTLVEALPHEIEGTASRAFDELDGLALPTQLRAAHLAPSQQTARPVVLRQPSPVHTFLSQQVPKPRS